MERRLSTRPWDWNCSFVWERNRLHTKLVAKLERLLVAWDKFGRPGPRDYDIVFVPRSALRKLRGDGREWMIERTRFGQIDRLSS